MRKFVVFFCLCMAAGMACARTWTHSAGGGISVPYVSLDAEQDGTKSLFAPQGNLRYIGMHENGFCVTAGLNAGLPLSKDFVLEKGNDTAGGFGMGLSLGAGYAFVRGEKLTVAALGSVGLDWFRFTHKKELKASTSSGTYTAEWTQTDNALVFGVGVEIFASYNLTSHLSLFADCAVRYLDAGRIWTEGKNVSKNYDTRQKVRGYVSITPALGVRWAF